MLDEPRKESDKTLFRRHKLNLQLIKQEVKMQEQTNNTDFEPFEILYNDVLYKYEYSEILRNQNPDMKPPQKLIEAENERTRQMEI